MMQPKHDDVFLDIVLTHYRCSMFNGCGRTNVSVDRLPCFIAYRC